MAKEKTAKSSEDYWKERIRKANESQLHRTQAQTEEALKKIYSEQSKKLYNQLLDVLAKIENDALDGKIYTNDLFRTKHYYELIEYFNKCAEAIGGKQLKITEKAILDMYKYAQSVTEAFLPEGVKDLKPAFQVPNLVKPEQAIHQAWCLDGKEFSERIWGSKQTMVREMANMMADMTSRGVSAFNLADALTKRVNMDLASAYRIARTESAHAQIVGQTEKYKEYGFTHGIFYATDPCEECAELDGQKFTLQELQTLIPRHPNCECTFLLDV